MIKDKHEMTKIDNPKEEAAPIVSAQEAFLNQLPSNIRDQIKHSVIDYANVPVEDLIRMAREAIADGDTELVFASRGDTEVSPLDYKNMSYGHGSLPYKKRDMNPAPAV